MAWTSLEARWRDAVLEAALPVADAWPAPPEVWARFEASAPALMRWGFRLAVWAITWAPVLATGRPLHRLPPEARARAVAAFGARDGFLARQIVLITKLLASMTAYRGEA